MHYNKRIHKKYKIIFLILNYKTYKDTIILAKEIACFQGFGSEYGVVIVDNASPNESWNSLLEEFDVKDDIYLVQSQKNGGYASGNNVGLQYMQHSPPTYVCIINNDVHFSESSIKKLVDVYERIANVGMLSPIQVLPDGTFMQTKHELPTFWDDLCSLLPARLKKRKETIYESNTPDSNLMMVDIIQGAFVFISYQLMESVGYYDERTFLFCEERILTHKVHLVGKNNYILLDETYLHQHSLTICNETNYFQRQKMLFDGKLVYCKYYRKHPFLKSCILKSVFSLSTLFFKLKLIFNK